MTHLIKATNIYRVPTVQDALDLRKELEHGAGELTNFAYATKYIKQKGEIIEEYQQVKATLVFNDEKEPESNIREAYGLLGKFDGVEIDPELLKSIHQGLEEKEIRGERINEY